MIRISVIIPTYNRAVVLKETLDCFIKQKTNNEFDYEIIIVDNNSNDDTKKVVESYAARLGSLTYLFEPNQGRANALNTGIKMAKGEIVSSMDDDCLVEDTYLWNVYNVFKECGPKIGILGGKIYPKWMGGDPPSWLSQVFSLPLKLEDGTINRLKIGFEGVLGILDYGKEPFIIDYAKNNPDLHFFGANMSFRKSTLEEHGGFNIDKLYQEDTDICERLFNAGVQGIYSPGVGVYHKIPVSKATPGFYYKWCFGRGYHMDLQEKYERRLGLPPVLIKKILSQIKKSFQEKDLLLRIRWRWRAFFNLGQLVKFMSIKTSKPSMGQKI